MHGGFLSTNDTYGSIALQTNGTLQLSNASVAAVVGTSNVFQIDTVPNKKALQVDTNGILYANAAGLINIPQSAITNSPKFFAVVSGGYHTIQYSTAGAFFEPYASAAAGNGTYGRASTPWPLTVTLTNMYGYVSTSPGGGTNLSLTIYTNGVASNLKVSLVGATSASTLNVGVPIAAGSTIAVLVSGDNTSASANVGIAWSFQYFY